MPLEPPASTEIYETQPLKLTSLQRDVVAGAVSGEIAGLVMLASMMIADALFLTGDVLRPLKIIGSLVQGQTAMQSDAGTVVTGLLVHMLGPSLIWGLVFGGLVHLTGLRAGLGIAALGPLVGMASQVVDVQALLQPVAGNLGWAFELLGTRSWFWHVIFGIALCVFPRVRQALFPLAYGR
jgi:hypothetical protein